jgi:hypothetical protein
MTRRETGEAIWQVTHMAMIRRALAKLDALAKVHVARKQLVWPPTCGDATCSAASVVMLLSL